MIPVTVYRKLYLIIGRPIHTAHCKYRILLLNSGIFRLIIELPVFTVNFYLSVNYYIRILNFTKKEIGIIKACRKIRHARVTISYHLRSEQIRAYRHNSRVTYPNREENECIAFSGASLFF